MSEKRYRSPWVTSDVLRCIRKKYVWFKLLKRKRINKSCYKVYCNALNALLIIAEEEYFENKFRSLGGNMKKNWKLLGDLMGRNTTSFHQSFVVDGRETDDPERIAQSFNNYFISYPKTVQG